jgi:hypothetical protein
LSYDENIDFDIEIIECEFKDSCQKHSELCFNEYKDVCSTRFVLLLNKLLKDPETEVTRKL